MAIIYEEYNPSVRKDRQTDRQTDRKRDRKTRETQSTLQIQCEPINTYTGTRDNYIVR